MLCSVNVTHWAFNCKTITMLFLSRPCGGSRRRRRHDARRVIQNRERFSARAEPLPSFALRDERLRQFQSF